MGIFSIAGIVVYAVVFLYDFMNLYTGSGRFIKSLIWSILWPITMVAILLGTLFAAVNASRGR